MDDRTILGASPGGFRVHSRWGNLALPRAACLWQNTWTPAILIILLAAGLRLNPWALGRELHVDEVFGWRVATSPTLVDLVRRTGHDANPPGYYILQRAWMDLLGDSIASMRMLSVLFGLLVIPAAFWFTRCWAGRSNPAVAGKAGLLAAALMAVSPPMIDVSITARMYPLLAFLALVSCAALLEALHRPLIWRWWIIYSVAAAAMIYVHTYGPILVLAQGVCVAVELLRPSRRGERGVVLLRSTAALGLVLAAWLLWLPWLIMQAGMITGRYWIEPLSWDYAGALVFQWVQKPLWGLQSLDPAWYENVVYGLLTLLWLFPWRKAPGEWLIFLAVAVHAVILAGAYGATGQSILVPRYLIYLLPLAAAPMAWWILDVPVVWLRRVLVFSAVTVMTGAYAMEMVENPYRKEMWRETVRELVKTSTLDEPVVVSSRHTLLHLRYHMSRLGRPGQTCYTLDTGLHEHTWGQHVPLAAAIEPEEVIGSLEDLPSGVQRIWVQTSESWPGWNASCGRVGDMRHGFTCVERVPERASAPSK